MLFISAVLSKSSFSESSLQIPKSFKMGNLLDKTASAPASLRASCEIPMPILTLRGGWNFPGKETFTKKEKEILQGLSESLVYTEADPGPWKEKITSHLPVAVLNSENGTIEVSLSHEMSDETAQKPLHYIEFICILSDKGEVLDVHAFAPTDEAPVAIFPIRASTHGKHVVPYAMCNLHGVWRGAALPVP